MDLIIHEVKKDHWPGGMWLFRHLSRGGDAMDLKQRGTKCGCCCCCCMVCPQQDQGNHLWVRVKPEVVPGSDQATAASSLLPSLPTDLFIISSCVICHNLWLVRPINHASEKMRFLTRRLSVSDKQGIIQLASFSKHLLTGFGKLVLFVI